MPGLAESDVVAVPALAGLGLPDPGEVVESGVTFTENALLKARALAAATGLPAVADDSGLCVAVLGGAPGIFSARWAGRHGDDEANLRLLLDQLVDVPEPHRAAWFECAAALVDPSRAGGGAGDGRGRTAPRARWPPRRAAPGASATTRCSCPTARPAPAPSCRPAEKDAISHRGQAVRGLAPRVAALLAGG